ncbi:hypothetical protein IEQ34_020618 [Dendrobium chrysotoxum]|uniref:Uncharacterized protein n=1 Tax=Dendrobium chrysotoxum TaxID=161865 RepID=A0AAV7G0N4_DENCH|nr:hypothetical protein IEQ34_020618 [Dendrobium chrysotoxum]
MADDYPQVRTDVRLKRQRQLVDDAVDVVSNVVFVSKVQLKERPDGVEAPCLSQGGVLIRPETLNENVPTTSFIASVAQVSIRWMVLFLRRPGKILDGFQEVSSGDRMDGVANLVMEVPDPLQDCFDLFHLHLPFHQTSDLGLGFLIPSGRSRNRECGFAGEGNLREMQILRENLGGLDVGRKLAPIWSVHLIFLMIFEIS